MTQNKQVALDANILLDMTRLKIDIFDQILSLAGKRPYELQIPIQVKQELEMLARTHGKDGTAAKVAIKAIAIYQIRVLDMVAKDGDEALQKLSQKGAIIATNDRGLRQSLKNAPQGTIIVRQSKYLAWA
jgi:rRNA-processing protein FCF1